MHWRLQGNEMIKHVTEKETQLSNMLHTCSEALKQVTAERDKLAAELKALRDSDVALPDELAAFTPTEILHLALFAIVRDYGDRRAMAERKALAPDALRYRWLRSRDLPWSHKSYPQSMVVTRWSSGHSPDEIDAAIDAAMRSEP